MLLLETGSQAKSLSTKTAILPPCFCLANLSGALGFPTRYRVARFNGIKSNSQGSLILWATSFAVSARSNLSWAKYESLTQTDLYRVASSFFRIGLRLPCNTSFLVVSWCAHCFSVHIASRFTDDEWSVSQIRFNVQVLSSLINSNSKHTIQQQKAFHV